MDTWKTSPEEVIRCGEQWPGVRELVAYTYNVREEELRGITKQGYLAMPHHMVRYMLFLLGNTPQAIADTLQLHHSSITRSISACRTDLGAKELAQVLVTRFQQGRRGVANQDFLAQEVKEAIGPRYFPGVWAYTTSVVLGTGPASLSLVYDGVHTLSVYPGLLKKFCAILESAGHTGIAWRVGLHRQRLGL